MYIYLCIYAIMKTMCPPSYYYNGFVATVHHVPKCISCHKAIVVITGRAHCFHDCIYIMPIYIYIYIWFMNDSRDTECSNLTEARWA